MNELDKIILGKKSKFDLARKPKVGNGGNGRNDRASKLERKEWRALWGTS